MMLSVLGYVSPCLLPSWCSKCQSGFMTLPPEPLQEQPAVVLLWGRPLASWLLALGERG
jgi:hypothetical protein